MKLECVKQNLCEALTGCERVTAKQTPLQVLSAIVLKATKEGLFVEATNLSVSVRFFINAKVSKEGEVAIPSKVLLQYINNLSDKHNINLEKIDNNLQIITQKSNSLLKTVPLDDYPSFKKINKPLFSIHIPSDILTNALKSVVFAASNSDIKPEIASVCISKENDDLHLVSTDSFRLAQYKILKKEYSEKTGEFSSLIFPVRNVHDMIRIFESKKGDLTLSVAEGQLSIEGEGTYFLSQLIEGKFPNLSQIFPKTHNTEAVLLKNDLNQSLRISQIFADKFNKVEIRISPKEKLFEIESKNQDTGENVNELDAALSGEDIVMQFNGRYIIDALMSMSEDSVSLEFLDKNRPLVIKGIGNNKFIYLLMPLRV